MTQLITIPSGHILFRPGQECSGFVLVHKGIIRVMLTAENGREIVLYRVQPGDICLQTFSALVHGTPYGAQGLAETDLEIEILPPAAFQLRVINDSAFRLRLFAAVADRFTDLERLVEDVALTGIPARLARALLRMADGSGHIIARHDELASEIGSAREVISRQLAIFARSGLIVLGRGEISVIAMAGLQAMAGEE